MPEIEMTDWFSFLTKPVHSGWYEVKTLSSPLPHRIEWSGKKWLTSEEVTTWRGCVEEQPPIVFEETTWKIEPTWKKSLLERNHFHKDDKTIVVETCWRWGVFHITTETDQPPVLEEGVDMFNCGYNCEMDYTDDGCSEDYEYFNMTEEEIVEVQNFIDENSFLDLEESGWTSGDCEMFMECEPSIEKVTDGHK